MIKTNKYFDTMLAILFLSFIDLLIYLGLEMKQAQKASINQPSEFITFEYEVSRIDYEGIYGDSTTDETGIYLTLDKLQPNQKLKEGDLIRVYFDSKEIYEGIEHVEVVSNE